MPSLGCLTLGYGAGPLWNEGFQEKKVTFLDYMLPFEKVVCGPTLRGEIVNTMSDFGRERKARDGQTGRKILLSKLLLRPSKFF